MSFAAAEENFHAGARHGIDAQVYWPGVGAGAGDRAGAAPAAAAGAPRGWTGGGSPRPYGDRLLGIIEQRCLTGRNGAAWQAATFHRLDDSTSLDRHEVLRRMTKDYIEHMHSNEPVHTWS